MKVEYSDLEDIINFINKHDKKFRIAHAELPCSDIMYSYAVQIFYEDRPIITDRRMFNLMDDEEKQRKKDQVHNYIYKQLMIRGLYACLEESKKHPPGPIFFYIR